MRNYIILNNQNSNTISGLIIQELAPISKPLQRTQVETIDGRDGDIVTPLGYAAYNKKIKIGLYGNFNINDIIAYFATKGTVIFSNEPDKYYYYQIVDQIDYERLVRYKVATVTMHVQPFKYSSTESPIIVDASDTVSGEGSNIALDGTAEAPFNILRHKGNATQKTLSGKNLLDVPSTYANESVQQKDLALAAGTYTLSFASASSTGQGQSSFFRVFDDNGTDIATGTIGYTTKKWTFTLSSPSTKIGIYSQNSWNNSQGVTTTFTNLMIESGATATDYEEFCGGIPSPSPDYPQDINVVTGDQTIKICGKNLLDPSTLTTGYINDSGGITTGGGGDKHSDYIYVGGGTAISLSSDVAVASHYLKIGEYDANKTFIKITKATTSHATMTVTTDAKTSYVRVSALYNGLKGNTWLELGNQATAYESYQAQEYDITLAPNIFNLSDLQPATDQTTITQITGGWRQETTSTGYGAKIQLTGLSPSTTYTLVWRLNTISGTANKYIRIFKGTGQTNVYAQNTSVQNGKGTLSFTTDAGATQANIWFYNGIPAQGVTEWTGVKLYSNASSIELCKIGDYADEPVKVDGVWKIRRAIDKKVYTGVTGEAWGSVGNLSGTPNWMYYIYTPKAAKVTGSANALCNIGSWTNISSDNTNQGIMLVNNSLLRVRLGEEKTVADWKTWLSTHNMILYYILDTPIDEAITDQDLIDALDAFYDQAHAYKGQTNITASTPNPAAPAVLSVDVNEDNESTVTNAGNTTSRPILTIYGQGNIGVYINDVEVLTVALGDEGYITLDSVEMEAYKDSTANLKNRLVTGDYSKLALNAGANKIRFTGIVTKYEISKYSRWL